MNFQRTFLISDMAWKFFKEIAFLTLLVSVNSQFQHFPVQSGRGDSLPSSPPAARSSSGGGRNFRPRPTPSPAEAADIRQRLAAVVSENEIEDVAPPAPVQAVNRSRGRGRGRVRVTSNEVSDEENNVSARPTRVRVPEISRESAPKQRYENESNIFSFFLFPIH